jgi:HlyD family secretion protein
MNSPMDHPIKGSWWHKKQWLQTCVVVVVALSLIAIFLIVLRPTERSVRVAAAGVTIATAEEGVFHDYVPLRGKITAINTVYIDAIEGGRVESVYVQAGDSVRAAQPLVKFSNTELELEVLDREGRLIESITQLQAYETQLEQNRVANQKALAHMDYEIARLQRSIVRRDILVAGDAEPAEVRDQVQDELNADLKVRPIQIESNQQQERLRTQQVPQIRIQLEKLRADLKITHDKLDNLIVRAPVDGRLTAMDLKIGENRNRGERIGEITANSGFKLVANVDEYYLPYVRVGQSADAKLDDRIWSLRVTRIYPQVKNGIFNIDLAFNGTPPSDVIPGQALQGKLAIGTDRNALIIPAGAFLERSGGDWILVLARDGQSARRRSIKIGRRNAEQVEVLRGLTNGERVLISDYGGLERIDRVDLSK